MIKQVGIMTTQSSLRESALADSSIHHTDIIRRSFAIVRLEEIKSWQSIIEFKEGKTINPPSLSTSRL
ncbi:hypothetical protein [Helicobacter macacae]|uniref:hypothetical protein n=1 Tax=Helicobacter macacae TaxID=398626 RepID=UPI0011DD9826|nr:hypothetical protein [Helicobacter macacae]